MKLNFFGMALTATLTRDSVPAALAVQTTWKFRDFWLLLNDELAAIGDVDADFDQARHYYDSLRDYSPRSAAEMIVQNRDLWRNEP